MSLHARAARRILRQSLALILSLCLIAPPAAASSLVHAGTPAWSSFMTWFASWLLPQGGVTGLDYLRANTPSLPDAYSPSGVLPGAGYDDPVPGLTTNFNAYLTELTKSKNDAGAAGSKPLQFADPTAKESAVGGFSINLGNQVDLGQYNFNYAAPVLALSGRAGLGLTLALSYNSRVWASDPASGKVFFNADRGFPGPGWRLGFGAIQGGNSSGQVGPYTNSVTSKQSFIYIGPDGTRRDLAYNATSGKYESYDSSYLDFDATSKVLRTPGGNQVAFGTSATANGDYQLLPTQLKDRNGNFIAVTYRTLSNNDVVIDYVTDTAGRRIDFYYENNRLLDVRQNRNGTTFKYVAIDYTPVTVSTNYGASTDPSNIEGAVVYLPSKLTYPTGHSLRFYYTSYAQMYLVEKWAPGVSGQGAARRVAYTRFNIPSRSGLSYPANSLVTTEALGSPPFAGTFNARYEQAENWENGQPVGYSYFDSTTFYTEVTDAKRRHRFERGEQVGSPYTNPRNMLVLKNYIYSLDMTAQIRNERVAYAKDTGPSYFSNVRPTEDKIWDGSNQRLTKFTYLQRDGMWLPENKDEYLGYMGTVYRRTTTEYTSYPSQHVLGLPSQVSVYAGPGTTLLARTANAYDETGSYTDSNGQSAPYLIDESGTGVVQHDDAGYSGNFTQRGNLTSITQYSVVSGAAGSPRIASRISYDTSGNVRASADGAGNRKQVLFSDNYLNKPGGVGATHVYVYTVADPTGFRQGSQHDYYTGLVLKTFNLRPGSGTEEQVTTTSYDFADRPLQTTAPDGAWARTSYWDNWLKLSIHRKVGVSGGQDQVKFGVQELDGAGRVRRHGGDHADAVAGKYSGQQFVYDQVGQKADISNMIAINSDWTPRDEDAPPTGSGWVYTNLSYDELKRLKLVEHPDGSTEQTSYVGCGCGGGLQTTITNRAGQKTRTTADFLGRLSTAEEIAPALETLYTRATYLYDELDRLVRIDHIDGTYTKTQQRSFAYDGYGRLQSETTPEGGTVTYIYKANDLVESVSNGRGKTVTHAYNTRNLPTGVSYNDSTPAASFSYDDYGARSQMTDGEGVTTYTYNSLRQVQSEARTFTGLPGNTYTVSYTYGLAGQVTRATYAAPGWTKNVNYAFNAVGVSTGVGTDLIGSDPNTTTNVINGVTYRGFGGIKGLNYGNGRKLSLGYEKVGQYLTTMLVNRTDNTDPIINQSYERKQDLTDDGVNNPTDTGRILGITDHLNANYSQGFTYDAYGRLIMASSGAYSRAYYYDAWGNLTGVAGSGGEAPSYTITYATNASGAPATNRISTAGGLNYGYDAAGNMTQEGNFTYTYDAANRLISAVVGGGTSTYGYDGDGKRVRQTAAAGTGAVYYIRARVLGGVALEVNSQGVHGAYVYGGSGQVVAQQSSNGQFYWVHKDHLGSGRKLTRTDGGVAYSGEFDPHGQAVLETPSGSTALNSHKFTGYERDAGTNLDYAEARMYHHNRGRFLQPDPQWMKAATISQPQSLNRYAYVNNNPVNFVDPTGLDLTSIFISILLGLTPMYTVNIHATANGMLIIEGGSDPSQRLDIGNDGISNIEEGNAGDETDSSSIQSYKDCISDAYGKYDEKTRYLYKTADHAAMDLAAMIVTAALTTGTSLEIAIASGRAGAVTEVANIIREVIIERNAGNDLKLEVAKCGETHKGPNLYYKELIRIWEPSDPRLKATTLYLADKARVKENIYKQLGLPKPTVGKIWVTGIEL